MPYKLVQTNLDPAKTVTQDSLESFWLFYDFTIDAQSGKIAINNGWFATYISQTSQKPRIQKPSGAGASFDLIGQGKQTIQLNNVSMVENRLAELSNEVMQLYLFKFNIGVLPSNWLNVGGWSQKFTNPTQNADDAPFLDHKFTLNDNINNRYIYWLSAQESGKNSTKSFALAMPFLNPSPLAWILANGGQVFPGITIELNEGQQWSYPPPPGDIPGNVKGFAMIAEGAFKSIPLNAKIDEWLQVVPGGDSSALIERLSQTVHDYQVQFSRTLQTADQTNKNVVVPNTPEPPIEILYMAGLNTTNPVPPIIT